MGGFNEGVPCWVDVTVPDLPAGKRFYGELFGWTFGKATGKTVGSCVPAQLDGKNVSALLKGSRRQPAGWNLVFAVKSVPSISRKVKANGGKVIGEPFEVDGAGTILEIVDPGGTPVRVAQLAKTGGFEVQGQPGSFFWPEIYTREKETVDPFYENVLGFSGQQVSEGPFDFKIWSVASLPYPIAGRVQMDMPPHVLVYFKVDDCDKSAEVIRNLGGRIDREPNDTPFGRSALAADDQGARFGIMGPAAGS